MSPTQGEIRHCRSGHEHAVFGFKNRGEGRICKECVRINSAKGNMKA